jgi:hypothetical protein
MPDRFRSALTRHVCLALAAVIVVLLTPGRAAAQVKPAIGEKYFAEIITTWWGSRPSGTLQTDRLDEIGGGVDLAGDFGFEEQRFREFRATVKFAKKHKARFQYTPMVYTAESVLTRDIDFGGETFPISLPIESELSWKVWRFGYEWDFIYTSRGFLGVLVEARQTELKASIQSILASAEASAEAPVPGIGVVARVYPLPDLAVHFEFSGMSVGDLIEGVEGTNTEMDLSATINITNNFGGLFGWRRTNTDLTIDNDRGSLTFNGWYFGLAVRY